MAELIYRDQNYVSSAIFVCIYTPTYMSKHSLYSVSDLEVSDTGDPLTGLFIVRVYYCSTYYKYCRSGESRSSHGLGDP
jgi:hypothetical protein